MPEPNPKYPKPTILLADLRPNVAEILREAGYNVTTGSFGAMFRASATGGYTNAGDTGDLPNYREQEVVVVDMSVMVGTAPSLTPVPDGETGLYVKLNQPVVDLRPVGMRVRQSEFDRVYEHGGLFVVFIEPHRSSDFFAAQQLFEALGNTRALCYTNWSFLTVVTSVHTAADHGTELSPTAHTPPPLARRLEAARFTCRVSVPSHMEDRWTVLATNKYAQPVAAVLAPRGGSSDGWIFLLPHVDDKAGLLREMLDEVLPSLAPEKFPHFEGATWTRRDEYELPGIVALREDIARIEETARGQVAELEAKIEIERQEFGYQHDLLIESGDALVTGVKAALERLGLADVRDVDEERQEEGKGSTKREDLQVHAGSPTLLVEVKGVGGTPSEDEAMQVQKYVVPRIQEWTRMDVQGLSVINHQRHLPALQREHQTVFQNDVLTNAEGRFGLMTTWDLFRLVRNAERLRWPTSVTRPLFYATGRIHCVPTHYKSVGVVDNFWERASALSIQLEGELSVGDTIAFAGPVDYHEQQIDSMQLNSTNIDRATAPDLIGITTSLSKGRARPGWRVFQVTRPEQ